MKKVWIFWVFPKLCPPPPGGVNQKKSFGVTHRIQGDVHAKFGWIHPVVWPPNPNKQTDRQTDRQASYIYIPYIYRLKGNHAGKLILNFSVHRLGPAVLHPAPLLPHWGGEEGGHACSGALRNIYFLKNGESLGEVWELHFLPAARPRGPRTLTGVGVGVGGGGQWWY